MERWAGRVALVTGASQGIGQQVARTLAQKGMKVVACARTLEQLQALSDEVKDAAGSILPVKCDLSKTQEIMDMFQTIKTNQEYGGVDVCINNAGHALPAPLEDGDTELWRAMLEVNVLGLCVCTRETLNSMKERHVDDGHIIHMNSLSGHRIRRLKNTHFYAATKFAITALTEGLRQELRAGNSNIKISSISPGPVVTPMLQKCLPDAEGLETSDIADAILYILGTPPTVQVHDLLIRPTQCLH